MTNTEGMRRIMSRASMFASYFEDNDLCVEYIFLSFLKFCSMSEESLEQGPGMTDSILDEIHKSNALMQEYGIDVSQARIEIRDLLLYSKDKKCNGSEKIYLERAEAAALRDGLQKLPSHYVLREILKAPSEILSTVVKTIQPEPASSAEPAQQPPTPQPAPIPQQETMSQSTAYSTSDAPAAAAPTGLPQLMEQVQNIRRHLLETVRGQDHAVHAFADAYFNAELLAASDQDRVRPKAVFVFAGPPGVGKTFLAEQAAKKLGTAFKRFDMSGYSGHLSAEQLTGTEQSYKAASPGHLSGFVKEHPCCFLLFDEIEKAHPDVIHLFLQILDAGRLHDHYFDQDVSFRDTIIIFTTNAGHNLYEGKEGANLASLSRRAILDALQTDMNPASGQPFFPAAICSRLASGTLLMFNHLQANDLEEISAKELRRNAELFQKQYGIPVEFDSRIPMLMLYKEGGLADARSLRAQTEQFFKNEIMKCLGLFKPENLAESLRSIKKICFQTEEWEQLETRFPVFKPAETPEILLFGDNALGAILSEKLPQYRWYSTSEEEEAFRILGEQEIGLVLLNLLMVQDQGQPSATIFAFDYVPMGAAALTQSRNFLRQLHDRMPELPVYLLERGSLTIDEALEMSFVQAGARGKLNVADGRRSTYEAVLSDIVKRLQLQKIAFDMAAGRQILTFETSPGKATDRETLLIRTRNYDLIRRVAADDSDHMVSDIQRPDVRFSDVIGAKDAKEELDFFIRYLKNPKSFMAKGMKPPKGVLLYGPPGTGKTMLAKAMAGESDVAFLSESATNFVTQYVGSGPAAVRELFERARRYAPAIIFIDEIDAIGRTRTGGISGQAEETTLNALLTEMDGFQVDRKRPVFILAATNFQVDEGTGGQGYLDPALVRRFDRKILVDLPDRDERYRCLEMLLGKTRNSFVSPAMVKLLAGRSLGMSPALLTSVVNMAVRMADRSGRTLDDSLLEEAFETTVHGEAKEWNYETLERVAWHEAAHALLYHLGGNTPAYLTIVARGNHGGYMEHDDQEASSPLKTREELLSNIRVSLAGRGGEILRFGAEGGLSSGASGDLKNATSIAEKMLCQYGMDDELGLVWTDTVSAQKEECIRQKIASLLNGEMQKVLAALQIERPRLQKLVNELMAKNRLTAEEIQDLLVISASAGSPDAVNEEYLG